MTISTTAKELLRRGRFLAYTGLTLAAEAVVPERTINGLERRARREVKRTFPEFSPFLEGVYNCAAHYEHLFDGRALKTLTAREMASLKLVGRIGTAFYRLSEDTRKGYGWDACGVAASLFELCWQARRICHDDALATDWLKRSKAPQVKQSVEDALKFEGVSDYKKQADIEYLVYGKLCDFKHGNPSYLSFHSPDNWENWGTMRLGPDTTPEGLYAICLAVDLGGFLALSALHRFTGLLHGDKGKPLLRELERLTKEHGKIRDRLNVMFKPTASGK